MLIQLLPEMYRQPSPRQAMPKVIRPLHWAADEGKPLTPVVRDIAASLGFDSFSYSYSRSPRVRAWDNRYCFTTLPREWIDLYNRNQYSDVDVRVQGIAESVVPMLWDSGAERGKDDVTDEFLDQMGAFGVRSGVVFGFHDLHHCSVITTFNSAKPVLTENRRALIEDSVGDLVLFAKAFHQFFMLPMIQQRMPAPARFAPLTARQKEVLELAADGVDNEAIADRLGISRSTVQRHIDEGRDKLGAVNRSHAVAVALTDGQIVSRARQITGT